ncbi:Utp14 protein-domain-containing protein [Naematelia encephala]|uniref:Utp14 protein-domain-containing protein n=1 Tax=Naematelia encephala TaxID=71784 RepID=A0A1Y2BBF1_9TREE|nr:Utp14 protein-domain-containing protein [Naematelia encephala]
MARNPMRGAARPFTASTDTSKSSSSKKKPSKRRTDPTNAYTFQPSLPKHHRTSAAQLSLSRDEIEQSKGPRRRPGDDDEGSDNDMNARIRKVAMMIANEGPGEVDSEESEVESDQAWEEDGSDEERWGGVFKDLEKGKGKKIKGKAKEVVKKPAKPLTVDLSEDEEPSKQSGKATIAAKLDADDDDEGSLEESDGDVSLDEDEDDDMEDDDDAEDDQPSDLDVEHDQQALNGHKETMSTQDSGSEEDDDDLEDSEPELPSDLSGDEDDDELADLDSFVDQLASSDKKRKVGAEEDSGKEKKRRVLPVVSGPNVRDGGDLGIKSNTKVDLASLIASHPSLSSSSASLLTAKAKPKDIATSVLRSGVLSAPLPTTAQERLDREAAYEKTKEEGAKWATLMKRVKEAEHLSFPLQATERGGVKSAGEMLAGFKPVNKHESAVQALLDRANLTDNGVSKTEEEALQGQDLSVEEIAERRAQLRQQRELLFRAEARSKRVAKIKSKTFRKLARKRAEKAGQAAEADEEANEEDQEKFERERARERATLRHGARSRWAKDVGGDGAEIEDRRRAKADMLDLKEKLTRKIHGDRSDGEDDDEDEQSDEQADEDTIKSRAFDQLAQVDAGDAEDEGSGKGLLQMAFMKKAEQRNLRKAREDEATLRQDIKLFGNDNSADEDEDEDGDGDGDGDGTPAMLKLGEGRMVFSGPQPDETAAPGVVMKPNQISQQPVHARQRSPSPLPDPSHNPWLIQTTSAGPSRKRNLTSNTAEAKATRALKKAAKGKEDDAGDERVEISLEMPKRARADDASEDEDELMPVGGVKAFKQRDLVAEAFAGDNVVEDFEKEKAKQIEADAPQIEDTSLPGWGSWSGKGIKKRKMNPKFLVQTAGIDPTQRKDAGKANVIITERHDKRAEQFLVKDLPYPYTSKAQYERAFANPVGGEWNSRVIVQKETLPRVVKKVSLSQNTGSCTSQADLYH